MGSVERLGDTEALRLILEKAHDAFVSVDAAGVVQAWNAAAEQLFGWPAREALGRPVLELIVPADLRDHYRQSMSDVGAHGVQAPLGERVETVLADRAGRRFPAEVAIQVGEDATGSVMLHSFVHDASHRHEAYRVLERERAFLETVLESVDVGVLACDPQGRLTVANQVARALIDPTAGRHVGAEGWADAHHMFAADGRTPLEPTATPLARALSGEQVDGQQVVFRPPGGPARRCHINARPIPGGDDGPLGAVAAVHDITERHRAQVLREAQLAVTRAMAEAESFPQAARGMLAAAVQALGWSYGEYWQVVAEEWMNRTAWWSRPGRDMSAFTDQRLSSTHEQQAGVRPGQGLPGQAWARAQPVWIEDMRTEPRPFSRKQAALQAGLRAAVALPLREGGQVLGVLVFCSDTPQEADTDLTALLDAICSAAGHHLEHRRARDLALDLAASRRQFDQIISQISDNVWTIEILPGGGVRSVYQSQDAAGVFGRPLSPDVDIADMVARHVDPRDKAAYDAFNARLMSGHPSEIECRITGLDGATRWIWIRTTPRREGGRLFVDGIASDVTERRRLAEERDRMKDELIALISHELRGPLGTIRGYMEMLGETGLREDQHRYAEVIDRNSAHLLHLVDDLLDLARLEAGHITVDRRPLSLARLIREAVEDHHAIAATKQMALHLDADLNLPVHGDPVRLRQVLDNLLSNAVKYTPQGGSITVTAAPGGPGADPADAVTVTVSDTGIGIPEEQYAELFTRFFRASTAEAAGVKGTGLGLAVTKAIIEAHGGGITAGPRPGGGTTFTFHLPAVPPASLT